MNTNTVTWWELPVSDLDQASAFYGKVFGWTFSPMGPGYLGIHGDGALIGGLFQSPGEAGRGIRVYVNVADLEAVLAATTAAGGAITTPRAEVGGDMGWWAEITDPGGSWLGLCTTNPVV